MREIETGADALEEIKALKREIERKRAALQAIHDVIQKDGWWWDSAPSEHQEVISEALSEAFR
jgi:malate synthase